MCLRSNKGEAASAPFVSLNKFVYKNNELLYPCLVECRFGFYHHASAGLGG
jgi:hypothetical protein